MSYYVFLENDDLHNKLKPYKKSGEKIKISERIKINNKIYREILFTKKSISTLFKEETTGILFVNENNEIVNQKPILNKLVKISNIISSISDEDNKTSLIKILQNQGDIEKDKKDYEDAENALAELIDEGFTSGKQLIPILEKVPKLRLETNEIVEKIYNKINDYIKENNYVSEDLYNEIYIDYRNLLKINFEKVKIIASCQSLLDDLKKILDKKRKKMSVRFNTNITIPLMRLDYLISYYKRIIRTYSHILNMTPTQYSQHLNQVEKNNINYKLDLLRTK